MRPLLLLTALLLVLTTSCGPLPEPRPPRPAPAGLCDRVCLHYTEMGCKESEPTPEGSTCVEVCKNMRDSPLPGVDEYYECVVASSDCTAAKACD